MFTEQGEQPVEKWTPAPTMVYLGRRLLCESAAHMLSPGLFPRLQAKVRTLAMHAHSHT